MILIVFLSFFLNAAADPAEWTCRNQVEIVCADGKCESSRVGEFTPMSISFNEAGEVSVCAYTGCWEGRGEITNAERFLHLSTEELPFSTSDQNRSPILIFFDKSDETGLVKAGGFANPVTCKKSVSGSPS